MSNKKNTPVTFSKEQIENIKKERIDFYKKDLDLFQSWRDYQVLLAEIAEAEFKEITFRYQTALVKSKMENELKEPSKEKGDGNKSTE